MAALTKRIWDISSQCDGAIELKLVFGRKPENLIFRSNLEFSLET